MNVNEDEYIERVLSKLNNKQLSQNAQTQPKKGKTGVVDMQSDIAELRSKLNEQSGYILEMTRDRDDVNYIEKIRKDNMLLYQTNEELRLIIRELQMKLNDMENEMKSGSKTGKTGANGFKTNKNVIAIEAARNEEREKSNEMLDMKNNEINRIKGELEKYRHFIEQLNSRTGVTSDTFNVDAYVNLITQANQRREVAEQKLREAQRNNGDTEAIIEKLNRRLSLKDEDCVRLDDENINLRNKLAMIDDGSTQLRNQLNKSDVIIRELREENNRLKDINNNLSNKMIEIQSRETIERQTADQVQYRLRTLEDLNNQLQRTMEYKENQFREETKKLENELNQMKTTLKGQSDNLRENRVFNAPSSLTTSNVDGNSQSYKTLYEKLAEDKRRSDDELRNLKTKYDSELRSLEISNRNFQNDKTFYTDKINRLQSDYEKIMNENTDLKAAQRKTLYNVPRVDDMDTQRLKTDLSQLNNENSQLKATLDFFQRENERIKKEFNDQRSKQGLISTYKDNTIRSNGKIADFQSTLQTYIAEKDQQIKETRLNTPCKLYDTKTRYEKSPNSIRYINVDGKDVINSGQKETTYVNIVDRSDNNREIDYLRAENIRLHQKILELTNINNENVVKIESLARQLSEGRHNVIRIT